MGVGCGQNPSRQIKATRCYAWSHELKDSNKRYFYVVLHRGPIDSPQAAIRAAIVNEFRKRRGY